MKLSDLYSPGELWLIKIITGWQAAACARPIDGAAFMLACADMWEVWHITHPRES